MPADAPFQEGQGCAKCKGRGTRGRVAILEILEIDADMRRGISADKDAEALRDIARSNNFVSMLDDAREKINIGFLSPQQAMNVLMGHEE